MTPDEKLEKEIEGFSDEECLYSFTVSSLVPINDHVTLLLKREILWRMQNGSHRKDYLP